MAGCGGGGHQSNNLQISLASGSVTAGTTAQLRAMRANGDGTLVDVTTKVKWSSSQTTVATVNQAGVLTSLITGTTSITASEDSASGVLTIAVGAPAVTALSVSPQSSSVPIGYTQQFIASATYADQGQGQLASSASLVWSVSPGSVATISQTGVLTAKTLGAYTVTATYGSVTAHASGTATNAALTSVAVTPVNPNVTEGTTQQFTATATFSDQTTLNVNSATTWSSSNTALLQINSSGVATAQANVTPGTVTVFAQVNGTIASTQVSVVAAAVTPGPALTALVVTPTASSVAKDTGQQLTATGYYEDGSQKDISSSVTWTSNNPSTSMVSSTGLMTTSQPGAATIQAQIVAPAGSVRHGVRSNATTTLQAQSVSLVTSATLVQVIAQSVVPTIPISAAQQLQLFGIFSDGSKQDLTALATWQSNNAAVATVSASGVATGVSAGGVTFTGSFGGQSDTTPTLQVTSTSLSYINLHITSAVLINGASLPITVVGHYSDGSTQDLTSLSSFASSDPAAVRVDSRGIALGIAAGESAVTATVQGQSSSIQLADTTATLEAITIVPASTSFAMGTTQPFRAIGSFSDGVALDVTAACVWGTTNPAVFTVDATGLAKSGSVGSAGVTASFLGTTGISGTVTVSSATMTGLVVSPASVQLASGTSQQLTAVASFSDGSTQDVTSQANWAIANESIAQTSNSGNAVAITPGTTEETATLMGFTGSTSVFVVSGATLSSVTITPTDPTIALPLSEQLHLIGTFNDGTTQDLTQCAIWSSSDPLVASSVLPGLVQVSAPGTATVTASCGGASAFTTVTSAAKTVASATIVPSQAQVAVGGDQSFLLVVTFTDGTTQTLASNVNWTSSVPSIGTMAGPVAGEDPGHAVGVSPGNTTITASAIGGPQQAPLTAILHVTQKPLSSIVVTPANPNVAAGGTQQLVAQATYTDGTGSDISNLVQWTSSNPTLVSVDANGLVTAHSSPSGGSATLTATIGTFVSSTTVTVPADLTDALTSIQVVPTSSRIANGTPEQLVAMGTYADGTTRDISSAVTWTSSNPAQATVSSTGVVTGAAVGTVTVQAQAGTLQSQSTVIVTAATLVSVAVSPSGATFANGTNQQFRIIGTFSDGSTQDLTGGATWQSSNPSVATISNTGLATGTGVGSVVLSATFDGQTASTSPSTVSAATLVSIAVQPSSASYAKGTSQQFTVSGSYTDGTTEDLTGTTTWQSADPTIVNISATGQGTGVGTGTTTITAMAGGLTANTGSIQITPATLSSISITPGTPNIAAGTTQQFTAIGTFSDGTTENLTSQVVWASTMPAVATINQYGVAESGSAGSTQISATYAGVTATTGMVQVTGASLTGFTISPNSGSVAKGTTQQFTATGTFSDGSTEDLTSQVNWSTSNSTALAINSAGLASGVGSGSAAVSATYDGQTMTTSTFQVTQATLVSVAVTPTPASIAKGTTQQFTLTGTFSDNSTQNLSSSASWSSSSSAVAPINSAGLASGATVGSTTITGQSGTQSATAQLNVTAATLVSIAVTPSSGSLPKGTKQQFTATATYSDGSTQNVSSSTNWISSNNSVITIDGNGLATAVSDSGVVNVTAQYGGQTYTTAAITASAPLLASITVTPANQSLVIGSTQQYTATGNYTDGSTQNLTSGSTWTSSTPGVATINSSSGLATAAGAGSTTIQAQNGTVSGTTTLTVTSAPVTAQGLVISPSSASIAKGTHQQFTASVLYSDGSTQDVTSQTTWQSSVTSVATISSSGLAAGVTGGTTQITGTYNSFANSVQLTVSAATLTSLAVTPASASIANGTTQQFVATGTLSDGSTEDLSNSVTWTSNNTGDATISATGLATAHNGGSTTITAQSGSTTSNGATLTITNATVSSISVLPASISLAAGNTQQLLVTANFTDGTSQNVTQSSTYVSSVPNVATVTSGGLVTTLAQGTSTVTVTLNANTATVPVAVSAATLQSIAVTPTPLSLAAGSSQQLTATGTYSDGSTANLTSSVAWSSSASNVLTVSTTGLLTSTTAGSATVTATLNGISGTLPVTVTSAVVRTIAVTPSSATLAAGQTQQYTAIATLSDNSQQTVTTSAHWSVSDSTRASISNTSGSNGLLTSIGAGTVTVSASLGSGSSTVTGTATVIITSATLSSIAVAPAAFTLATGTTEQLTVTGTYSDGSNQDLTATAVYSSNASATASVSRTGLVTGTAGVTGVATITATVGTTAGTATATVTPNTLVAIAVTPATTTIANGLTQQFTATGTYAGNQQNITSQVQWTSSNPAFATINSAGLATAVGAGTTTITATSGGTSGSTTLTVGSAVLESLTVTSVANSFANGTSLQLHAMGNYSDGSTEDLTNSVTWTSLNTAVGVVSQAGVASGVGAGVFGAQASLNGHSATKSITVTNAVLQSITLTPANQTIVSLAPVQYTATGHFSDGSTQVLTTGVHWYTTSSLLGIQVGTISQSGSLTAVAVGTGTVNATYGNITGTTNFTVVSL